MTLVFIQTAGTAGTVDVHVEIFLPWNREDAMVTSTFTTADGPNGAWQIADMVQTGTFADLVFIKTRNTSGHVEVHYDKITGNTARRGGDWSSLYPSSMATTDAAWLMAHLTSASGKPDLVLIQTANTRSGNVELSCATGASNYSKSGGHWISAFNTDAAAGTWCLADMDGDGRLDLVRIQTADTTSGQIEVYYASAASGYKTLRGGASEFNLADGANGVWEVLPAG